MSTTICKHCGILLVDESDSDFEDEVCTECHTDDNEPTWEPEPLDFNED
jgi:hypothetical protein